MNISSIDIIIVGGGLAGLAAGIVWQKHGYQVKIFEKEIYPRHKVCGEYVSCESLPFLQYLGVDLLQPLYPKINELILTTSSGRRLQSKLNQGGVGISRYQLDNLLAQSFLQAGGELLAETTITNAVQQDNMGYVEAADGSKHEAKVVVGAWGKRSRLDIRMNRKFVSPDHRGQNEFSAVKYHVRIDAPENIIGLHLFPQGYCGFSAVENDTYCLCYLVRSQALKSAGGILQLEQKYVRKNAVLNEIWKKAQFDWEQPLTISQISFASKKAVEDHMLMLGDAAGLISPLSGNGMSIALHSASLAVPLVEEMLNGHITPHEMEVRYNTGSRNHFSKRYAFSRWLQEKFFREQNMNKIIDLSGVFPPLKSWIIRSTHGRPFYP